MKMLFAETINIYLDFVLKSLQFGPKLPYIKSSFSKNQGGFQKLDLKTDPFIVVLWKYEQ